MHLVSPPSFPNSFAGWQSPVGQKQRGSLSSIPHSESDHNAEVKKPNKCKKNLERKKLSPSTRSEPAPSTLSIHTSPGFPIISHLPTPTKYHPLEILPVCGYTHTSGFSGTTDGDGPNLPLLQPLGTLLVDTGC